MLVKSGSPAEGVAANAVPAPEKHNKTKMAAIRLARLNMVFSSFHQYAKYSAAARAKSPRTAWPAVEDACTRANATTLCAPLRPRGVSAGRRKRWRKAV